MRSGIVTVCSMLLCVSILGCDGGSSGESIEQDVVPTAGSTTTADAATPDVTAAPQMDWELVDSLSGALRQPVAWAGGFAAINFPDGDASIVSDGGQPGELWLSTDGLDWAPARIAAGTNDVSALAGDDGVLFTLTGDILDNAVPQTLWRSTDAMTWTEVLRGERLEHIAVGAGRLIAYRQNAFEMLGVFDTTTLEQVEFEGVSDDVNPTENTIYQGRAVGLDDGFIARVGWIESVSPDTVHAVWRLLYSADGSTWIEHPAGDSTTVVIPYGQSTAPNSAGLNLLTADGQRPGASWVSDTGLDLQRTPPPVIETASGTPSGFFEVADGTIRHSTDAMSWESMDAPPTWSTPSEMDKRGFAEARILTRDDTLIAIGVHGMFEGWVGLVEPTTDVWIATI